MNPQQLRLYAVTDRSWLKPGETLAEVVETLLKAGVTCVQLREKEAEDAFILQEARELKALCHRYGVPFLVNDRPDLAQAVGADGVHVGQEDTGLTEARNLLGPQRFAGRQRPHGGGSVGCSGGGGGLPGLRRGVRQRHQTQCQPDAPGDLDCHLSGGGHPCGGHRRGQFGQPAVVGGHGIAGVAVISGLFAADDKTEAAQAFLRQLEGLV